MEGGKKEPSENPEELVQENLKNWGNWEEVVLTASEYDLIEINRGLYQHWVMYLGNENIIHVTQVDGRTEGNNAEKRLDKIKNIAREDKCRVNNQIQVALSKGLTLKSSQEILQSISDVVNEDSYKIVPYSVHRENCEYYVTAWKYGNGFSIQIENVLAGRMSPEMLIGSMELLKDLTDEKDNQV